MNNKRAAHDNEDAINDFFVPSLEIADAQATPPDLRDDVALRKVCISNQPDRAVNHNRISADDLKTRIRTTRCITSNEKEISHGRVSWQTR